MNSSEQSAKQTARASLLAPLSSNWIEIFAVPIASAIMETQPIALILPLLVPRLLGTDSLLDTVSITGLMLYFQWWAMFVGHHVTMKQRSMDRLITRYDLLGMLLGLALFAVLHIPLLGSIPTLFVVIILTVWFWKRGKERARVGLDDEQLITEFKVGFSILVIMLVLAFLSLNLGDSSQSAALSLALPIYFLAGVIALSFTRIGKIQQESSRNLGSSRKETSSRWILVMTVAWIFLIIVSIALEALPFQVLMYLLSPFIVGLTWLAQGLLAIFGFLLAVCVLLLAATNWMFTFLTDLIFHKSTENAANNTPISQSSMRNLTASGSGHSSVIPLWFGQVGVGIIVLCALVYFVRFMRRRTATKRTDNVNEEDETREALNKNDILKARRNEQKLQSKEIFELEALDPHSVRARYRDFLLSMAAKGADVQRQDQETPAEYQQRLLEQAEQQPFQLEGNSPANFAILTELTLAYARERYGDKELDNERHNYLNTWVPLLVRRLVGRNSPRLTPDIQRKAGRTKWL